MADKEVRLSVTVDSGNASSAFQGLSASAKKASNEIQKAAGDASKAINSIGKGSGQEASSLFTKLSSSAKEAVGTITKGMGSIKNAMKDATNGAKDMNRTMNALSGAMALGVAGELAGSLLNVGIACVKSAGQMQQYEIAFQTMMKSTEKGTAMLNDLQQFAAKTPFDVPGVVETAQQLMAFGFEAEKIIPTLRTLGDASAALGKGSQGVSQLGYALGQISTSGTLKTQDVNQLTNAGIDAWTSLAQAYGTSIAEIRDATEKGMIDSADAVKIITDSMDEKYGGMMEKTENTINGMISNITESAGNFAATMGAYLSDAGIGNSLKWLGDKVSGISTSFQNARKEGQSFTSAIANSVPAPVIAAFGALAAIIGTVLLAAVGTAVVALGTLIGLTAPIVAGVAAVGAVVATAIVYWDSLTSAISNFCSNAYDYVANLVGDLLSTWSSWIDTALSYLGGFLKDVFGDFSGLYDGVVEVIGNMWDTAISYTPSWVSDIANACSEALDTIKGWADTALSWISEVWGKLKEVSGMMGEAASGESSSGSSKSEAIGGGEKEKPSFQLKAPSSGGGGGGGGGGSSGGRSIGTEDLSRKEQEINRLTESMTKGNLATQQLSESFRKLSDDANFQTLSASDQVYQQIENEKNARLAAVDEALAKQKSAVDEAMAYRDSAEKTGDANAIAQAKALYDQRNQLYQQSLQQAEGYENESGQKVLGIRASIEQQAAEEALTIKTQLNAAKAAMDEALNAASYEEFLTYLYSEQEAKMASLQEEMAQRQQLLDWRMESQQTILDFEFKAAETMKNQLASGLANLITEGGSLAKVFTNLTKQIVNMFLQWMIQKKIAAALDSLLGKKANKEAIANAQTQGQALVAPAVQKSIAELGPIFGPPAYAAAVSGMMALGAASILNPLTGGAAATGGRRKGLTLVGEEGPELVNFKSPGMVYTAGETESILNYGMNPSMVSMASYAGSGIRSTASSSGIVVNATLNNYGDIHTGQDADDLLEDFSGSILVGLMGG